MAGHSNQQDDPEGRGRLCIAAALTAIAGSVDAIGFLAFSHIYTANMSGNSVAVGIGAGTFKWSMFAFRFWPIFVYVLGLMFGRALLEVAARMKLARAASIAFLC